MNFASHHARHVTSTLTGFDRLVLRGSLLPLMRQQGMHVLLAKAGVRLLDFGALSRSTSEHVKDASLAEVGQTRRPVEYLGSSRVSEEDRPRQLLAEHPLSKPGLVCAFKTIEPCMSFECLTRTPSGRSLKLVVSSPVKSARLPADEAHHVWALEVLGRVADQGRVDRRQRLAVIEHDVGGPLSLTSRPVVVHRPGGEDPLVPQVQPAAMAVSAAAHSVVSCSSISR